LTTPASHGTGTRAPNSKRQPPHDQPSRRSRRRRPPGHPAAGNLLASGTRHGPAGRHSAIPRTRLPAVRLSAAVRLLYR
jgi:hypothetical protein